MRGIATVKRSRSCLINAFLLAVGLLLAFGAGELLLRMTKLGSPSRIVSYGRIPAKSRPFARFLNRKENENMVVLNNWGFHDYNRRAEKSGYRIVAFGDSFVEGNQVTVDQLFTTKIERALGRRMPGAEVVNAGFGGAGTAYEYLLYNEFFKDRIEMDHVLLFLLNGNDLPNNHPLLERHVNGNDTGDKVYVDGNGDVFVKRRQVSRGRTLIRYLDRHSAIFFTIHLHFYRWRVRSAREKEENRSSADPAREAGSGVGRDSLETAWQEAVAGTLRLIARWNRELDGRRVTFSVVVIPFADHYLYGNYANPHKEIFVKELIALGKADSFSVLELDFSQHDPFDIYSFDGKILGHFNHLGHEETGRQVAAWLLETVLEPPPGIAAHSSPRRRNK